MGLGGASLIEAAQPLPIKPESQPATRQVNEISQSQGLDLTTMGGLTAQLVVAINRFSALANPLSAARVDGQHLPRQLGPSGV